MKKIAVALSALALGLASTGCQQKVSASAGLAEADSAQRSLAAPRDLIGSQIHALFADKTVKGHHEVEGYDFQSYYAPGGRFWSYEGPDKKLRTARWWVQTDQICVHWDDKPEDLCRKMVVDSQGHYRKEKELSSGRRKVVVTFNSFTPGDALHLKSVDR